MTLTRSCCVTPCYGCSLCDVLMRDICYMYTRITKTADEAICRLLRADNGSVRQRVVANLWRLDQLQPRDLDPLIGGLHRAVTHFAL